MPIAFESLEKISETLAEASGVPFSIIKEFFPDVMEKVTEQMAHAYRSIRGTPEPQLVQQDDLIHWRQSEGFTEAALAGDMGGDGSVANTIMSQPRDPTLISPPEMAMETLSSRRLFMASMKTACEAPDDFQLEEIPLAESLNIDADKKALDALRLTMTDCVVNGRNKIQQIDKSGAIHKRSVSIRSDTSWIASTVNCTGSSSSAPVMDDEGDCIMVSEDPYQVTPIKVPMKLEQSVNQDDDSTRLLRP